MHAHTLVEWTYRTPEQQRRTGGVDTFFRTNIRRVISPSTAIRVVVSRSCHRYCRSMIPGEGGGLALLMACVTTSSQQGIPAWCEAGRRAQPRNLWQTKHQAERGYPGLGDDDVAVVKFAACISDTFVRAGSMNQRDGICGYQGTRPPVRAAITDAEIAEVRTVSQWGDPSLW